MGVTMWQSRVAPPTGWAMEATEATAAAMAAADALAAAVAGAGVVAVGAAGLAAVEVAAAAAAVVAAFSLPSIPFAPGKAHSQMHLVCGGRCAPAASPAGAPDADAKLFVPPMSDVIVPTVAR